MPRRYRKRRDDSLVRYEAGEITADQVRIARERTAVHLCNIHLVDYSIVHLVVDCYLQGCRDMAEAVIRNPGALSVSDKMVGEDDALDYQREGGD